jgi:hypothetical protein
VSKRDVRGVATAEAIPTHSSAEWKCLVIVITLLIVVVRDAAGSTRIVINNHFSDRARGRVELTCPAGPRRAAH